MNIETLLQILIAFPICWILAIVCFFVTMSAICETYSYKIFNKLICKLLGIFNVIFVCGLFLTPFAFALSHLNVSLK
jgi:hypothetical protein